MLFLVRHGETQLNAGDERMRGWLPVPLNPQGMKGAAEVGRTLSQIPQLKGLPVWTSDLPRAVQTAHDVATSLGSVIQPRAELKDWNTGNLVGTPVKSALPTIFNHLDHPQMPIPGGESFRDFFMRDVPFLKRLIEDPNPHVAVSHNRVTTLVHALSASRGEKLDMNIMKNKGPIDPSGFMVIQPNWNISYMTPRTGQRAVTENPGTASHA